MNLFSLVAAKFSLKVFFFQNLSTNEKIFFFSRIMAGGHAVASSSAKFQKVGAFAVAIFVGVFAAFQNADKISKLIDENMLSSKEYIERRRAYLYLEEDRRQKR